MDLSHKGNQSIHRNQKMIRLSKPSEVNNLLTDNFTSWTTIKKLCMLQVLDNKKGLQGIYNSNVADTIMLWIQVKSYKIYHT